MQLNSVGIIGLGSFGKFAASLIPENITIYGFDRKSVPAIQGVQVKGFAKTMTADVVILAIPLEEYGNILPKIKEHLKPTTLLIDACSVKLAPEQLLLKHLPAHPNLLLTHPLFGPQSATESTTGHKLIITKELGDISNTVVKFCVDVLKLSIKHLSAEEHDRIMANVHALTFFVARGLADIHIDQGPFITPSYQTILDLIAFSNTHSQELFNTVQLGNPYAKATRQQLLKSLQNIDKDLSEDML